MKQRTVIIAIAAAVSAFLIYRAYSNHVQAQRDARYQEILSEYKRRLHPGMRRREVKEYLQSRQIQYSEILTRGSGSSWSYFVKIGEEPGHSIVCNKWQENLMMDFESSNGATVPDPKDLEPPQDPLKDVRLMKEGQCL